MRRGFKAACERISAHHRVRLGLTLDSAFDPRALASDLGVTVWKPEDVPGLSPQSLSQLVERDGDSWSAVTVRVGSSEITLVNSAHAETRQRSSLAHELAHLLLEHEPDRIDVSDQGLLLLTSFEREHEEEANWLAGALLVPREGLRKTFRQTEDIRRLAERFRVSTDLLQWRLRTTGVALQAKRAQGYYRRRRGSASA